MHKSAPSLSPYISPVFDGGGPHTTNTRRVTAKMRSLHTIYHIKYLSKLLLYNFFCTTTSSSTSASSLSSLNGAQGQALPPSHPHPTGATAGTSRSRGQLLEAAPGILPPVHPERAGGQKVGAARVATAAHLKGLAVEPPLQPQLLGVPPLNPPPQRGPPGAAAPCRSPWTACGSPECGTRTNSLSSVSRRPWSAPSSSPQCCCRHPPGKMKLHCTISVG